MKNLTKKLCLMALLFTSLSAYCQYPKLNSNASVQPTIFLDFDGQFVDNVWNNYTPFYCDPCGLSTDQMTYIFNIVSEDYRPFNINVTTDSTKYWSAPATERIRVIVTPTSAWYPNVGGIAYTGSFTWGSDLPVFAFTNRVAGVLKNIAEVCSHESGHALGLSHQAKFNQTCGLVESYNSGSGSGEIGWAPIMGKAYGKNMTGWNEGPTPYSCSVLQDNLSIITTQNGFTYRTDDYRETLDNNTNVLNEVSFNAAGIITTTTDKDAFKFTNTITTPIHIEIMPFHIGTNNEGANLDVRVQLFNSASVLIRTYNPETTMGVTIDTTLATGAYYLVVDGTGNLNTSSYGSLGSYNITGSRGVLAIRNVTLKGNSDGKTHKLQWQTIADEPIAKQVIESSTDGIHFETILTDITGLNSYVTNAKSSGNVFYRLKVTSVIGESMYSNIIVLKANGDEKLFTVSTMVYEEIRVIATEDYQYKLYDANARLIAAGNNKKGINSINVSNTIKGMYVLQMMNNNYKQTERIIKQ
jgi:Metallo-peptidase family M12B Reprolysin-like